MGIRFLNRYMKDYGFRGIIPSSISILRGKTIVIDASIYLYRFKSLGQLATGMDAFLRMFQQHHIIPIFVFDGPPRSNKKELLQERQRLKHDAWKQYKESPHLSEAYALKLKKTFTRISKQDVDSVKEQLKCHHIQYIDAPHEADEVCAKLMKERSVDACMSDDMDMFMYGCKWVIRDVDLTTQTIVSYYTKSILQQLGLTLHEFKQIGVLSGSDYYKSSYTLYNVMSMFHAFKRTEHTEFYEWVHQHYKVDADILWSAYREYDITQRELVIYTDAGVAF